MWRLPTPRGRAWLVPLASLVAAATVTAIVGLLLFDSGDGTPQTQKGPSTLERVAVLAAPREGSTEMGTLEAGEPVRIDARTSDGRWVEVVSLQTGLSGWLSVSAIADLPDLDGIVVAGAGAEPSPTATATPQPQGTTEVTPSLTPDYPDLIVSQVFARQNHLVVVVANEGNADADGPIEVSVDDGPWQRIDVGKALRPGDHLEQTLTGEYVQRRAEVVVSVRPAASLIEENAGNNIFTGFVTPDAPNDIELVSVEYGGADPHLIVTIRNRSPIPIRGVVTIGVRQTSPQDQLLLRDERALDVEADATQSFEFPEFTGIPLEFVRVILSTDAITDSNSANNTLPR